MRNCLASIRRTCSGTASGSSKNVTSNEPPRSCTAKPNRLRAALLYDQPVIGVIRMEMPCEVMGDGLPT